MARGTIALGFILAECYDCYDQIVDFCTFHGVEYHSELSEKRLYLFSLVDAVKVFHFLKRANLKAIYVNVLKDEQHGLKVSGDALNCPFQSRLKLRVLQLFIGVYKTLHLVSLETSSQCYI